jgi:hypothetical protein
MFLTTSAATSVNYIRRWPTQKRSLYHGEKHHPVKNTIVKIPLRETSSREMSQGQQSACTASKCHPRPVPVEFSLTNYSSKNIGEQ